MAVKVERWQCNNKPNFGPVLVSHAQASLPLAGFDRGAIGPEAPGITPQQRFAGVFRGDREPENEKQLDGSGGRRGATHRGI